MILVWAGLLGRRPLAPRAPREGQGKGIMTIEYRTKEPIRRHRAANHRASCLDCADCQGLCWSALQLRLLPDLILKDKGAPV
jgi:hypothetical protein